MLIVLSPAKRLAESVEFDGRRATQPEFLDEAETLVGKLRRTSHRELAKLMRVGDDLAALNRERYASWSLPFNARNATPAVLTFRGDVYLGLGAEEFSPDDLAFAQKHVRILSGLYGVLRPLDLMQPYRLEMGTPLSTRRGRDLYAFWGDRITESLNAALAEQGDDVLVNLASNEYFRAVRPKKLAGRVVTPVFKERKGSGYRTVAIFAKRARGLMTRYAVAGRLPCQRDGVAGTEHGGRVADAERLKDFDWDGYAFDEGRSTETEWVFARG